MKVALISTNVLPSTPWSEGFRGYGGLEPVVGELAKGLAALDHEVTLYAAKGTQAPGVDVHEFREGAGDEECFNEYHKELGRYDVVQDHSWTHWPVIAWMKDPKLKSKPQVFHHGVLAGVHSKPPLPCNWTAFSHAQSVYVGTNLGIPCRYVHHGIPLECYPLEGNKEDYFLLLTRLSPEKGVLPALEMLKTNGKRVVVVADDVLIGGRSQEYAEQVKRLCDGKQATFVPGSRLMHEDKVKWLQGAQALVSAPQYPWLEIFGLSVVEAMACGTPVLALRNGALPELILHGETGYLADTVDGLAQFLDCTSSINPGACRVHASHFSVAHMAAGHEKLLADIAGGNGW